MYVVVNPEATGERIEALRIENDLSVKEMAEQLGVCEQAVYHWQQGRTLPKLDLLCELAAFFGKQLDDIIAYDVFDDAG